MLIPILSIAAVYASLRLMNFKPTKGHVAGLLALVVIVCAIGW